MSSESNKPRVYHRFDEKAQRQFLDNLSQTGNVEASAAAVGVTSRNVRYHMERSDEFREAVEQARASAMNDIEKEILRRGLYGDEKPVFYQGKVVGSTRQYSDKLLLALAKANAPERYAERQHIYSEVHHSDPDSAKAKLIQLLQDDAIEGSFSEISTTKDSQE